MNSRPASSDLLRPAGLSAQLRRKVVGADASRTGSRAQHDVVGELRPFLAVEADAVPAQRLRQRRQMAYGLLRAVRPGGGSSGPTAVRVVATTSSTEIEAHLPRRGQVIGRAPNDSAVRAREVGQRPALGIRNPFQQPLTSASRADKRRLKGAPGER